ncbi:unnamed protein product [Vicia faba]|uniref:Uncharacterized protein n=1 Tax=Vicia faba TaxID=3906 RepID=A0AAV1A499_VICFA|nr:unnamed protein product [Vicia faba]
MTRPTPMVDALRSRISHALSRCGHIDRPPYAANSVQIYCHHQTPEQSPKVGHSQYLQQHQIKSFLVESDLNFLHHGHNRHQRIKVPAGNMDIIYQH